MRCVLTFQPFTPRLCNAPKFILHGKLYNIAAEKGTSKVTALTVLQLLSGPKVLLIYH